MNLRIWEDMERGEVHYDLVVTGLDIARVALDHIDRALVNEVERMGNPSIADIMLALEALTRRISGGEIEVRK